MPSSPRYRARFATFAMVVRAFALLLSMELSGSVHAALDIASSYGLVEHPEEDCEGEEEHECPPGCLNCHCVHAALAVTAPVVELRVALIQPPRIELGFVPLSQLPTHGADMAPLYRPPRLALAS